MTVDFLFQPEFEGEEAFGSFTLLMIKLPFLDLPFLFPVETSAPQPVGILTAECIE